MLFHLNDSVHLITFFILTFYFIIRFHTPRDYFEVNAGRVQISSMREVSVSTQGREQKHLLAKKSFYLQVCSSMCDFLVDTRH